LAQGIDIWLARPSRSCRVMAPAGSGRDGGCIVHLASGQSCRIIHACTGSTRSVHSVRQLTGSASKTTAAAFAMSNGIA
jgi:hypothetical protein